MSTISKTPDTIITDLIAKLTSGKDATFARTELERLLQNPELLTSAQQYQINEALTEYLLRDYEPTTWV